MGVVYYQEAIWAFLYCLTIILGCSLMVAYRLSPLWISSAVMLVFPLVATALTMALRRLSGGAR